MQRSAAAPLVPPLRAEPTPSCGVQMADAPKKGLFNFGQPASPTKPKVTGSAKPLSPGSNYP